jgi:hypothetical protein
MQSSSTSQMICEASYVDFISREVFPLLTQRRRQVLIRGDTMEAVSK